MKGLLLKDIYIARATILISIITCIVIAIGLSMLISPSVIIIISAVVLNMTILSTILSDKKSKWSQFAITLPVSKKQIISSKYIEYIIMTIIGIVLGVLATLIILAITDGTDENIILFIGFSVVISFLSGSLIIPFNFIFSEEKASIVMIIAYTFVPVIITLLIFILNQFFRVRDNLPLTLIIGSIVSIIFYLVSWVISQNKVKKFN